MTDLDTLLASIDAGNLGDLDAVIKHANKMKREAKQAAQAIFAENGRPLVEAMILETEQKSSDSSDWTGYGVNSVPITVDGVDYVLNVTLTDVAGKAARKAARELREAQAIVDAAKESETPETPES